MATPTSNMSESGLSAESWVVVPEKQHTKERSPQYNVENECQAHLANTASHGGSIIDFDSNTMDDNAADLSRKTVSNIESAGGSTETSGTCETVTGLNLSSLSSSVATIDTLPTAPVLTENTLERLQRELNQCHQGSLSNWLEGAGWGDRFASNFATASVPHSILGRKGQSTYSRASSVSLGFEFVAPPRSFSSDTRGLGAWCQ